MNPEILTYVQFGVSLIVLCAVLYKNNVLNALIKTQAGMLESLKSYSEIFKMDRLKEYGSVVEAASDKKVEIERQKIEMERLKFQDRLQQVLIMAETNKEQFEKANFEVNKVFFDLLMLIYFNREQRRDFLRQRLPTMAETYIKLLDEFEKSYEQKVVVIDNPDSYTFDYLNFIISRNCFQSYYHNQFYWNVIMNNAETKKTDG